MINFLENIWHWFTNLFVPAALMGASVFIPAQGGTGIGSAVVGDVGKVLSVSSSSPFTYSFVAQGGTSTSTLQKTTIVTTTVLNYSGNFASSTKQGYVAANYLCNAFLTSSTICTLDKILSFVQGGGSISGGTGWLANGPPGYVATANDCAGYTTSSPNYYGAFWAIDTNGGQGNLTTCNLTLPITCCL